MCLLGEWGGESGLLFTAVDLERNHKNWKTQNKKPQIMQDIDGVVVHVDGVF